MLKSSLNLMKESLTCSARVSHSIPKTWKHIMNNILISWDFWPFRLEKMSWEKEMLTNNLRYKQDENSERGWNFSYHFDFYVSSIQTWYSLLRKYFLPMFLSVVYLYGFIFINVLYIRFYMKFSTFWWQWRTKREIFLWKVKTTTKSQPL